MAGETGVEQVDEHKMEIEDRSEAVSSGEVHQVILWVNIGTIYLYSE